MDAHGSSMRDSSRRTTWTGSAPRGVCTASVWSIDMSSVADPTPTVANQSAAPFSPTAKPGPQ